MPLGIGQGGTSQPTAPGARKALGLEIGVDIQAWDADLDALSALATTGIAVRTAANTWATRTLVAPAAGITITNPAGIAGDITFALSADLAGLEALSTTGLVTRTASNTYTTRTLTGTANEITVTNGNGVSGDPTLSLPSSLTFTGKTITGGAFTGGTWDNGTIGATTASSGVFNALTLAATQPTLVIKDTANTGNSTIAGVGFYDSAGTRKGFIGDGNTGNQQVYLVADAGPIEITPGFVSGNENVILTKGQLTFPATQNASSDANTLDDYEEGTWTPTYSMTGTNFTSVTYSSQNGYYTKIGNMVFATWILITSAVTKGAASGNLTITGLPFSSSNAHFGGYITFTNAWLVSCPGGASVSVTTVFLYKRTTSDGGMYNMAVTDVGTGASANQSRGTVVYTI